MFQNKEILIFGIISVCIILLITSINFFLKIKKYKKDKVILKSNMNFENFFLNLNPSEKVLCTYIVKIVKMRNIISAVMSETTTMGYGLNMGLRSSKNIMYRKINPYYNFHEQTMENVKFILTTQRIFIISNEYSLINRHLNIGGLYFANFYNDLYLILNQKSSLKVIFSSPSEGLELYNQCFNNTYLSKRLKKIN